MKICLLIFGWLVLLTNQLYSQTYHYKYNGKISIKNVYGDKIPKIDFKKYPAIVTIEKDEENPAFRTLTIDLNKVGKIKIYLTTESTKTTLFDSKLMGYYSQGKVISEGTPTAGVLISNDHLFISIGGDLMFMIVYTNDTSFYN